MLDWLYIVAGTALLLLLATDVFHTVFHAEGRGGPLNRRQNRAIWRGVRWAGTSGGVARGRVLSLAGPLMAITTIAAWTLLLIGGFALIHLPFVLDYHYSPGQPGSAILEALYYSGMVGATLGHGDVVAPAAPQRILTIVQALSGFALVTVAVTYVLGVYRELIAAQSLATVLDARLREPSPSATGAAATIHTHDDHWDRAITLQLARTLESHFNYPILHYFRASRMNRALLPQLARLRAAALEMETGPPSHDALMALIGRYIGEVHALFVRHERATEDERGREGDRLREILGMMAYDDSLAGRTGNATAG